MKKATNKLTTAIVARQQVSKYLHHCQSCQKDKSLTQVNHVIQMCKCTHTHTDTHNFALRNVGRCCVPSSTDSVLIKLMPAALSQLCWKCRCCLLPQHSHHSREHQTRFEANSKTVSCDYSSGFFLIGEIPWHSSITNWTELRCLGGGGECNLIHFPTLISS